MRRFDTASLAVASFPHSQPVPGESELRGRPDAAQAKSQFESPTFPGATHERSRTNYHARTKVASSLHAPEMVALLHGLSTGTTRDDCA
jgi:hypothetical protein